MERHTHRGPTRLASNSEVDPRIRKPKLGRQTNRAFCDQRCTAIHSFRGEIRIPNPSPRARDAHTACVLVGAAHSASARTPRAEHCSEIGCIRVTITIDVTRDCAPCAEEHREITRTDNTILIEVTRATCWFDSDLERKRPRCGGSISAETDVDHFTRREWKVVNHRGLWWSIAVASVVVARKDRLRVAALGHDCDTQVVDPP